MRQRLLWAFLLIAAVANAAPAQHIRPLQYDRRTPVVRVFETAKDAVVNISTTRLVSARSRFFGFGDDAFEDIFQSPFSARKVPVQSLGSGFVIHPTGYIITNEHVVRRASQITVSLADKSTHTAKVIATDPEHDLAVLKIAPANGNPLPALPLGRSDDLMIGESVIAIGNPKGYRHSVTSGVVSALGRQLDFRGGVKYAGLIQTDASINPGNSGGPLLNINAEVIGINTAIRPDAQGICFAIAINDLTEDLPKLLDFRRINRVELGLEVRQNRQDDRTELIVGKVVADSPAQKAGAAVGATVTALDGKPVGTLADFYVHMLGKAAGEKLTLQTGAGRNAKTIRIPLTARPKPDGRKLAMEWFGVGLQPLTPESARRLRLPTSDGMLVTSVAANSPASRIGLRVRDIVFQLDKSYVGSLADVGRVLEETRAGQTFRLGVARGHVRAWTQIQAKKAAASKPAPALPETR